MGIGAGAVGRKIEDQAGAAPEEERLGGARADFAASLGRRVAELSVLLTRIEEGPRSGRFASDLRRKLHALSAGARLLRFTRLAEALGEVESAVDGASVRGIIPEHEAAAIRAMLERLPALAWSRAPVRVEGPVVMKEMRPPAPLDLDLDWQPVEASEGASEGASEPEPVSAEVMSGAPISAEESADAAVPMIALVVGPPAMAEALRLGEGGFEVERIDDAPVAIDLARSIAPDVMLIDADREGARQLVEALVADPLTEAVPILVAGSWSRPEDAGSYASLGIARALAKPISPDALRRACAEAAATFEKREPRREPLGELSVAELGDKLAEEIRRGLTEAAVPQAQGAKVDFGDGSDVLAAVWGAVARVRDIATIRSQGLVRFTAAGPEGALPFAPWLGDRESDARPSRVRFAAGEARGTSAMRLDGIVAVVVDDDAAVTWFLADVLKSAGATVHTAVDGARALELAYQVGPDLVISDVLMPEIDGFKLSRALKRDVALRDVPVILLSWKEDLLQRVRELGAPADGYLRKQASAATIVQRVREVMGPRSRVLGRLVAGGEVKGRLDGLTTRTLLSMVCSKRPSSTLSVWDASHLYEVEIRDGRPVRATRTGRASGGGSAGVVPGGSHGDLERAAHPDHRGGAGGAAAAFGRGAFAGGACGPRCRAACRHFGRDARAGPHAAPKDRGRRVASGSASFWAGVGLVSRGCPLRRGGSRRGARDFRFEPRRHAALGGRAGGQHAARRASAGAAAHRDPDPRPRGSRGSGRAGARFAGGPGASAKP
ncbi:MAG: response regulator [Polyangiaceae bacterium]|nr:response regulator [Polyangiaceae bacterium]